MIRQSKLRKDLERDKSGFRIRGREVSRLEGFSDAVLAFTVTLLVVSLEVPSSFDELQIAIQGFFPFAVCFIMVLGIWVAHYNFFRKYGLNDGTTIVLNGLLLFVMLIYVYPLKFLFTLLINQLLLKMVLGLNIRADMSITSEQVPELMLIYGAGFLMVFLILSLMHVHALRQSDELELNGLERHDTKSAVGAYMICVIAAIVSMLIAATGSPGLSLGSGAVYSLIGPAEWLYHHQRDKTRPTPESDESKED